MLLPIDTETCGLHSICLLIQYSEGLDGEIKLYETFTNPIYETLELIEWVCEQQVIGFNLAFDWFHLQKLYNVLSAYSDKYALPIDIINELGHLEKDARLGDCIKPTAACDLMLHARKGKYQSLMGRKDIYIRKVPVAICRGVHETLENEVVLDSIYFAKRKNKSAPKWAIIDREDTTEFKDIVLRFRASGALKTLAQYALNIPEDEILLYSEPEAARPLELGYAPFAEALTITVPDAWYGYIMKGKKRVYGRAWPGVVKAHILHWEYNTRAREYAADDVKYTRDLYTHLGSPEPGDDDSELACMVGSVRWRGYPVDLKGVRELRDAAIVKADSAPKAPAAAQAYLTEVMSPIELVIVQDSTKKIILEEIAQWQLECEICHGTGRCKNCGSTGYYGEHPAANRAKAVLGARQAKAEVDIFNKLLTAGRFHTSFVVIGALSSRMSGGGGGFNPQGIKRATEIREKFNLADDGYTLCGGDFDSFEVVLAIAYYGDAKLEAAVKSGKKIHGLFGLHVYPDMTYDEILADKEKYTRAKSAVFAMIYGGEAYTLKNRLGVPIEVAEKAFQAFIKEYPGIGAGRLKIHDAFCSMRQEGGIGTRIEWHDPQDYIESMFGFRRDFSLENRICRVLFNLASKPPAAWKEIKGKCFRRDREQTVTGAARSAIFAAAFAIQSANMRAAGNHVIQSSGATTTKHVQRRIWDVQPHGVHQWRTVPMNVHDEIIAPTLPEYVPAVKAAVNNTVSEFRDKVPLIAMDWKSNLVSWADK